MKTEIVKAEEFGIEEKNAAEISAAFEPKIQEREELNKIYTSLIKKELTPELCKEAKELRLKLVKVRTGINSIHKTQKAYFLAAGRYVDAWKKKEVVPVELMEDKLLEIEMYYELIEADKQKKLEEERKVEASKYFEDESMLPANLGAMDDNVYSLFINGAKAAHEERKKAAEEAEKKRIEEEKLDELELSRIKQVAPYSFYKDAADVILLRTASEDAFNTYMNQLKARKEAADNERAAAIKKADEAAKKAEKLEKEQKKKDEEARKKLKEEEDKRIAAEKELAEKKRKEQEEEDARKAEAEAELLKGDAAKVNDLVLDLESLKAKYTFKSAKNKKMYSDVNELIDKIVSFIRK